MIFLTVGTLQPFDRLVKAVDALAGSNRLNEPVFGQIGFGDFQPSHIQACSVLKKNEFDEKMQEASLVISHAGMGSIITAVNLQKPMIVMPRLAGYGEHVNDHQLDTALKFEELGVILAASDEGQLAQKIETALHFKPAKRRPQIDTLTTRVSAFLNEVTLDLRKTTG